MGEEKAYFTIVGFRKEVAFIMREKKREGGNLIAGI